MCGKKTQHKIQGDVYINVGVSSGDGIHSQLWLEKSIPKQGQDAFQTFAFTREIIYVLQEWWLKFAQLLNCYENIYRPKLLWNLAKYLLIWFANVALWKMVRIIRPQGYSAEEILPKIWEAYERGDWGGISAMKKKYFRYGGQGVELL